MRERAPDERPAPLAGVSMRPRVLRSTRDLQGLPAGEVLDHGRALYGEAFTIARRGPGWTAYDGLGHAGHGFTPGDACTALAADRLADGLRHDLEAAARPSAGAKVTGALLVVVGATLAAASLVALAAALLRRPG